MCTLSREVERVGVADIQRILLVESERKDTAITSEKSCSVLRVARSEMKTYTTLALLARSPRSRRYGIAGAYALHRGVFIKTE